MAAVEREYILIYFCSQHQQRTETSEHIQLKGEKKSFNFSKIFG